MTKRRAATYKTMKVINPVTKLAAERQEVLL
jgi:hypothetical protein